MLLTATLALQCPGHLRLYIRLDYAGGEGMVAGARKLRLYDASAGQHRTRAGNAGDGTATTASGAGRAPVNGLPYSCVGPRGTFRRAGCRHERDGRDEGRVQEGQHHTRTLYTWREMSCVYRVSRL